MNRDDMWNKLKKSGSPIVLYGTGNGADKVINELEKRDIALAGIFASDGFVRDRYFRGFKVKTFEECLKEFTDMKVLMCFGSSRPEVLDNVNRIRKLCDFYVPDVPVYGNELFDGDFYSLHKSEIERVRELLCDKKSIQTFDGIVNFKLTGKPEYLFDCETSEAEADRIINLPKNSHIADFGAYNGDTVLKFAELYPDYGKITAIEPDMKNYTKLCRNTENLRDVCRINALVSDRECVSLIDRGKGRGVHEAEKGEDVKSVTVDGLFFDSGVDFIKFDVEGNELSAIRGGIRTVKKYHPRMTVACYHRSEDIFRLPLEIMSVYDKYKVYLRHLPGLPAWDSQFYFCV